MIFYYEYEKGKFDKVNVQTYSGIELISIVSVDLKNVIVNITIRSAEILFNNDYVVITGLKNLGDRHYEMNSYHLYIRKPKVKNNS